jgi:hypothetical protein
MKLTLRHYFYGTGKHIEILILKGINGTVKFGVKTD